MELTLLNWLLAIGPIIVLMVFLLLFKWEPCKAGVISWLTAMVIAYLFFGADNRLIVLANNKGISTSLYVLLIIWGALFLYNVVEQSNAIKVIGNKISMIAKDKYIVILLLAWCFTSLLQGLAGFGVPVAVVAPIMVAIGFDPVSAVIMCLVGHTWSISFGSMGSSYNAIQLVQASQGVRLHR